MLTFSFPLSLSSSSSSSSSLVSSTLLGYSFTSPKICHGFIASFLKTKNIFSLNSMPPSLSMHIATDTDANIKSRNALDVDSMLTSSPSPPQIFYQFESDNVEAVRIRHILVETEEMADYLMKTLCTRDTSDQMSASFQDLANTLSKCTLSNKNGGDLGWVYHAQDENMAAAEQAGFNPAPDLKRAAFEARPMVITKVQSYLGWHVFRVEDAKHVVRAASKTRGQMKGPLYHERSKQRRLNKKKMNSLRADEKKEEDSASEEQLSYDLVVDEVDQLIQPQSSSYCIVTMGCQMNQADSERMAGNLELAGWNRTEDPFNASLVVFNTCSIRDHSEQKVYSLLGRQAQRKRENPESLTLVVSGCVAQQEGEALLRRVPELDLVMGPQYANRIAELVDQVELGRQIYATEPIHIMEDVSKPRRESEITAWVNVIYGCNERCTYCVVPNARGLEQSRTKESIKAEIENLAAQGYREIVLLGQNIDAYGRDLRPRETFTDLLHYIHDVSGIERIRYTTSHPRYMTERLIKACGELPKVCEYFHVPFQAGNNKVLREMARGYTRERFLKICSLIKKYCPNAAISADAIVGFPGETEEEFQETLSLMDEVIFDTVHTAAYSPRPNTPAALYENQLPEDVKEDRLLRINEKTKEHAFRRSQGYIGQTLEVLVEDQNPKKLTEVFGRSRTNRLVFFEGDFSILKNKLVNVKIDTALPFRVYGKQVGEPF